VFSGIDYLRYVDDAARAAQRAARERAAAGGAAPAGDGTAGGPTPAREAAPQAPGGAEAQGRAAATGAPEAPASSGAHAGPATPAAPAPSAAPAIPAAVVATTAPASLPPSAATTAPDRSPSSPVVGPSQASPDTTDTTDTTDATGPHVADALVAPAEGAPADPWAAAAAIAHERSLRDDGPDRPVEAVGTPAAHAPDRGAPDETAPPVAPQQPDAGPTADASAAAPPAGAPSPDAVPTPDASPTTDAVPTADASVPPWAAPPAAAPAHVALAAPSPGRPALPAPDAPRVPLDELLARPTAPWPPASGPQTVIDPDDDLKTAFFLTDSSFGPLPGESSDVMPPTSIHRPGAQAEAVTRVHGEASASAGALPGASATSAASAASSAPAASSALPGLPLRPERGAVADDLVEAAPAFVPVPPPFEPAPRRAAPSPPEPAAIDYFPAPRRRSRSLGLALSPTAWVAAIGLSALLVLQAVVGWRDAIAARVPLVAPTLAGLLGPFGLEIRPPRELDALTIEGFELQASGTPNVLALSAVLRNRSGHVVGYPAMELTLTDSAGALIVRKVIPPDLYVGDAAAIEAGLAARSERPLRLALRHDGLQPTGFAVALFYP
jgi:hypothetical protein